MKTGKIITAVAVTALAVATTQGATINKWTGGTDGNWTNTANWSLNQVPILADEIARFDGADEGSIIDSAVPGTLYRLELGRSSAAGTLEIQTGGSLTVDQFRMAAKDSTDTGTIDINGGDLITYGGNSGIGYNGTATVNLNSGTFSSTTDMMVGRQLSANGTLNVNGGTLSTVGNLIVGRLSTGDATAATGLLNITGGTTTIGDDIKVSAGGTATMTLSGGTVSVADRVDVGENDADSMGSGTLTVSGTGDLTTGELRLAARDGWTAVVNLNDGDVHADKVTIDRNGTLNWNAGTLDTFTNMTFKADGLLVWEGDHKTEVEDLATAGTLTGSGGLVDIDTLTLGTDYDQVFGTGAELVVYKYDGTNTEVWTVIPEPATLGMVATMSGALLFIRRRFMI